MEPSSSCFGLAIAWALSSPSATLEGDSSIWEALPSLVVLAAGEWPEEDLGTWRREAATAPGVGRQRRPPSRRREREGGGGEGEIAHAGG